MREKQPYEEIKGIVSKSETWDEVRREELLHDRRTNGI
jgi:hypothetical protein